jgi:hypothetical protein
MYRSYYRTPIDYAYYYRRYPLADYSRYAYYRYPSDLELSLSATAREALIRSGSPVRSESLNYSASPAKAESTGSADGRKVLAKILRHIATEESAIELRRQGLCSIPEFQIENAFKVLACSNKDADEVSEEGEVDPADAKIQTKDKEAKDESQKEVDAGISA